MAVKRAFVIGIGVSGMTEGSTTADLGGNYILFDGTTKEILIPAYPGGDNPIGNFGGGSGDSPLTYDTTDWKELVTNMIQGPNHENDSSIHVIFLT